MFIEQVHLLNLRVAKIPNEGEVTSIVTWKIKFIDYLECQIKVFLYKSLRYLTPSPEWHKT